ncbi:hypothetical protein Premu_1824 [Hallella multisaccharivorax DSM 17128]|uniref:Uncharacterized protein n=1 Tax=Hallella multisaccharivorax DSM 17128 TaxID=688246 RepID=F8N6C3_9BACT|nr:hypothetical protein [Hallella multisaccharivorax]EGN57228.1 hypothetical protein Premu_1824 [Hallella multisaccharivorax DSM 17128]
MTSDNLPIAYLLNITEISLLCQRYPNNFSLIAEILLIFVGIRLDSNYSFAKRVLLTNGKTRHLKRSGSTDVGHIVRVKFLVSEGDTLVQGLEETRH